MRIDDAVADLELDVLELGDRFEVLRQLLFDCVRNRCSSLVAAGCRPCIYVCR
jgi:hypothetical protein